MEDPKNREDHSCWEQTAFVRFEEKMTDKSSPFPCIPATIGFSTNQLRYGFVGDPSEESTLFELASILKQYTEVSRKLGKYTSLIIFYKLTAEMKATYTVEQYEQLFWNHLSNLTALDEKEWPEGIKTDPHDSLWEFCFHGEKYFIFCATPAHSMRKSRHFPTMMLAITPRWVLKEFNSVEAYAPKIKKQIRNRLSKYDSISIHPALNSYGDQDNFEWKQYYLRDDHTTLSKCPFHKLRKMLPFHKGD
jgi:uncharacterized protein